MPYLYLTSETPWAAAADALTVYLDRAGVNLRRCGPDRREGRDALHLVLHGRPRKSPGAAVYYTPVGASVRFSFYLRRALSELPVFQGRVGSCAGAIGGSMQPTGVPTVLLVIGAAEPIPADPLARAIARAVTEHFRLPGVEPMPEEPIFLPRGVELPLLRYPNAGAGAYHTVPGGDCLSILGACGGYTLARHRETVGFMQLGEPLCPSAAPAGPSG